MYYSCYSDQYILDKSTYTWNSKVWNGYSDIYGGSIWSDGTNTYYSFGPDQYVLNKSTWNPKTWNGFSNIDGRQIWTDDNIYYSCGPDQYVLS